MHWYLEVLRKYAVFSGRARRSEYWYFALFNTIIIIMLAAIVGVFGVPSRDGTANPFASVAAIPYMLYIFAVLIPSLAVSVRRLHDVGRSGWWVFISLVPLVGGIWLLILHCMDSQPGENQYGPNPKESVASSAVLPV